MQQHAINMLAAYTVQPYRYGALYYNSLQQLVGLHYRQSTVLLLGIILLLYPGTTTTTTTTTSVGLPI